ncbi:hypothetical protein, partial [Salmonella enterica]|uniref:hypothetical protein n=1 Tax=Salmonella enterica TaxID=28901 RepID=UPI003D295568
AGGTGGEEESESDTSQLSFSQQGSNPEEGGGGEGVTNPMVKELINVVHSSDPYATPTVTKPSKSINHRNINDSLILHQR